jgi:protein Mpv17
MQQFAPGVSPPSVVVSVARWEHAQVLNMRAGVRRIATSLCRFSTNSAPGTPSPSLFAKYNNLLLEKPVVTKSVTAGVIAFAADIICQKLVKIEGKVDDGIDWRRTFNFTMMNLLLMGPAGHFWYGFLMTRFQSTGLVTTLQRVVLDQLVFGPLVALPVMFAVVAILNGKPETAIPKIQADWKPTVLANWAVWIPAQFINFKFVPAQFQVLFANMIGLGWNIYLSGTMAKELPSSESITDVPQLGK